MQCLSQEGFEDTLTKECILKCIGIICTNAIGVDSGGKKGRVLYEVAALASHNCQMNSVHQVNPTDFWYMLLSLHFSEFKKGLDFDILKFEFSILTGYRSKLANLSKKTMK